MLKRKNEEEGAKRAKRVALDAEALEDEGSSITIDIDNGSSVKNGDEQKRVSSHRVSNDDDPTYVHFRMLCQVKEAGLIVGRGGETINHIKQASGTRINVSENIRGVMERVIHVMGPSENVAKAFGLLCRAILGEDETRPSGPDSRPLQLQLLIQHQMIGYVIGKQGLKFREIEDASAAKLAASPSPLPYSTDRVLTITGVADALHIAVYYVSQTILNNKSNVTTKPIFYDPGRVHQPMMVNTVGAMNPMSPMNINMGSPVGMMGYNPQMQQPFMQPYQRQQQPSNNRYNQRLPHHSQDQRHGHNEHRPHQQQFMQHAPLSLPLTAGQHLTQDIYIPDEFVGNVIGKSGKNIKQLKEASGSHIMISDPEEGKSERKITLIGSAQGNQTAIYLINNRIEVNKKGNEQRARREINPDEKLTEQVSEN